MHMQTEGIVLREVSYKEADKILTVLTRKGGKMTLSARNCRRAKSQLAASAQLLVYSDLTLYEYQGRWAVKEAAVLRDFDGVRGSLEKLALASYLAELTECVTQDEEPAPDILSLLLNSLHALDALNRPLPLVKASFELKLMCLAGYQPRLDVCAVCGKTPEEPRLHLQGGVLHCPGCRAALGEGVSLPLNRDALAAMRRVAEGDPRRLFSFRLAGEGMEQMTAACEGFVAAQLERGFRTLDFWKQITWTGETL